jgi:CBS domain containing-hemolysin-like protein
MGLAVWSDISLMWLIVLTLIAILPFAVLFFFAIRGLHRLRQLAKQFLPIAQQKARLVADTTDQISLKVTSPIIGAHARAAQVNTVRKAILTRRPRP